MRFENFDDLPNHIKSRVVRLGQVNNAEWVLRKIPALGGRSIVEVMNLDGGEEIVREFLAKAEGKF